MILNKTIIKSNFSVEIQLELLKYSERIKLLKEMNFQEKDGKIDGNAVDQASKLEELVKKQIKSIKVKTASKEFNSIEELEYFDEYTEIINELSIIVLRGPKMGEI